MGGLLQEQHEVYKQDAEGVAIRELTKRALPHHLLPQMQQIPELPAINPLPILPAQHLRIIHPPQLPLALGRHIHRLEREPQVAQLDDIVQEGDGL